MRGVTVVTLELLNEIHNLYGRLKPWNASLGQFWREILTQSNLWRDCHDNKLNIN